MPEATDTIMTLDDLTAYIKLSQPSLYKLCQAGALPGTQVGRHWRFHRDVIETWIKTGVLLTRAYGRTQKERQGSRKARRPC